jgi:predicted deacylase
MDDLMQWTKEIIPIKQLASGESLSITTHTLKGNPGPHIHIQASVHGAELQGNAVILMLMDALRNTEVNGSITFVPLANPFATNNKHGTYTYGRYNPVTGDNWNRNYIDIIEETETDITKFCQDNFDLTWDDLKKKYKTYLAELLEAHSNELTQYKKISDNNKLNLILQNLALRADAILDLHTGPTATRYLYSAEYAQEASNYLLFKHILIIPHEHGGAMDEAGFMPWVHLMNKMKELGRDVECDVHSFTLEFGSEETFCMDWATKDVQSILNYLKYKGVIADEALKAKEVYFSKLENYRTIYSPIGGLCDYRVKPGDHYKKGDILANIYQLKGLDPTDPIQSTIHEIRAIEDGIIINRCPSSSIHEGMELLQVMTKINQ